MRGFFATARTLHERGVLGINRRNADYTLRYNPRHRYPLVDDKALTKTLATEHGVAVPELYSIVEIEREVRDLPKKLAAREEFVVKPARGSQGDGILVVTGRAPGGYRTIDGHLVSEDAFAFHVSNILSGIFSLGGVTDKALIEYRVRFAPVFDAVAYRGVPDLRIIVFLGVPVMAMVRLPTRRSGGRANLHQGAIGAGIDMASGRTLTAVSGSSVVETHPDTGTRVAGIEIPHWQRMLEIAARSYELTGLGYQGIDIVLDRDLGPLVLELNARPGLAIQIANRAGLGHRVEAVLADQANTLDPDARVSYARARFAAQN
ncbi:MAG: alpha-L-glutamate ligase-like protein [Burkholderiales bacterium]